MPRPAAAAVLLGAAIALAAGSVLPAQSRIKVLLVTGQSNQYHNWEVSSPIVRRLLAESGRFDVATAMAPPKGAAPNQDMSSFAPNWPASFSPRRGGFRTIQSSTLPTSTPGLGR